VTERVDSGDANDAPFEYLESVNHRRLARIMTEYVPEVSRLNRIIEQRTGYQSEIGRNMMVDVLSHLGTLASRQDLTPEQQATQLSKIEEHLRRAIIEHPEEVVRERIVEVAKLWSEYQREAYAYREQGVLRGVPRHQDLEESRKRIDVLMESVRKVKPDETTGRSP
jgi:ppGpp synthetase/RelA/SpoT-type nucleotidyltranferase